MLNKFLFSLFYGFLMTFQFRTYLVCPSCATLDSVPTGGPCNEPTPGIEPMVAMRDSCDTNIPDVDTGTSTISLPITINGGGSFYDFKRIDSEQSSISGEKALDANRHTWTAQLFVPGNDEETHAFVEKITTKGFYADCIVTDKMSNQYLYQKSSFSYTYGSQTDTDDAGDPGWTLTLTTRIYPKIYTNTIRS